MLASDALDVFGWDVEKVRGDGSAAGEHQAGTLDALVDGVGGAVRVSASGPRAARERRGDGLHV